MTYQFQPPKLCALLFLVLSVPLFAQDERSEFLRIKELARIKNWANVIQQGQAFAQRHAISSNLVEVHYLIIVAKVEVGDSSGALTDIRRFERLYPRSAYLSRLGFWEGRAQQNLGNFTNAELAYKKQLQAEPEGPLTLLTWFYLAQVLEKQQKFKEAEDFFTLVLRGTQDKNLAEDALIGLSRLYRRQQTLMKSRNLLQTYVNRSDLSSDRIRFEYASVLAELDLYDESLRYLVRLIDNANPFRTDAALLAFDLYRKTNQHANAIKLAETFPSQFNQNQSLLLSLADSYRQVGNLEEAQQVWRRIMGSNDKPSSQIAAFNLGLSLEGSNNAIEFLQLATQGPDNGISRVARWKLSYLVSLREQGQILESIINDPKDAERHVLASRRLLLLAQQTNNRELLIKSLDFLIGSEDRTDLDKFLLLRAKQRSPSEYDLALSDLQRIVQTLTQSPLVPQALYEIGSIYASRAEYTRAEGFFHRASQMSQGELKELALLARGISFFNAQNFEQAFQVFELLRREHPQSPHLGQASLLSGKSLIKLNRETEARQVFQRVIQTYPTFKSEAHYELGILDSTKNPQSAVQFFLEAYRSSPENSELKINSLDAALSLFYREGDLANINRYLTSEIWNLNGQTRLRLQYWQTLVLLPSQFNLALNRAQQLASQFPRILLDMENLKTLSEAQRLTLLDTAVNQLKNEDDAQLALLKKISLLSELGRKNELLQEIGNWLKRFGHQDFRFNEARILARFASENSVPGLENAHPVVQSEFLLRQAFLNLENNSEHSRNLVLKVLRESTTKDQRHEAQWLSGMIQLKMGNIVEARQLFQAILRETPIPENRANVLLGLGLLENSQNNYQEALRTWRQAAQLGPWDSSARSAYEAYQLAKKLGQSAEVLFFKNLLTQNFPRSPWIEHLE